MNERIASRIATLIAKRWPARILATVNVPINHEDGQGYSVRVVIPREHRVLRLGREAQLPGILDVCTALMTPDDVPLSPVQTLNTREEKEEALFKEEKSHVE